MTQMTTYAIHLIKKMIKLQWLDWTNIPNHFL